MPESVEQQLTEVQTPTAEERLLLENNRLHRALRAMYTRDITWLPRRWVLSGAVYRVGLYDLEADDGPSLVTVYNNHVHSAPMIRVSGAREWAEGILVADGTGYQNETLQTFATDVLRFLGEYKL